MCTISRRLYDAKQITLVDHAELTLDPTKIPGPVKGHFLTPADQSGKRDWIAEWEAQADMQLKSGDTAGYQGIMDHIVHGILERLEKK